MRREWKVLVLTAVFFGGCGSTFKMNNASTVPAAEGNVTTRNGPNNNTKVKVVVQYLAQLKTFELTISPESSPMPTSPTNAPVLTAHVTDL